MEELAQRSDLVFLGTPLRSRAFWDGGVLATAWEVRVDLVLRGEATRGATVTLEVPGGVLGNIAQQVPGVPALTANQPYVMLLSAAPARSGVYYLAHLTASLLRVVPDGSATVVQPPAEGLASGGAMRANAPLPLGSMVELLRGAR